MDITNDDKTVRYADLFCGIGAFHTAFSRYPQFKCVFASDIDETARRIYHKNHGMMPYGDIWIEYKKVPDIDLLCAGFPCQAFSIAGKKKGFDDDKCGNLFYAIIKIIDLRRPQMCILENVKNLETHDGGNTLKTIYKELTERHYFVSHKILNSYDAGSPQYRKRIFIFATLRPYDITLHMPTNKVRVCDILLDDDEVDSSLFWTHDPKKHKLVSKTTAITLKTTKPVQLYGIYSIATNKGGRQGERVYSTQSAGITICAASGGPGSKTGLYMTDRNDSKSVRKLSLIEVKRMFGFPDDFDMLDLSSERAISYFGNSIVVNVVSSFVDSIASYFAL